MVPREVEDNAYADVCGGGEGGVFFLKSTFSFFAHATSTVVILILTL